MPILQISALPQPHPDRIAPAMRAAAAAIAESWGCDLQYVSVVWNEIPPGRYLEGGQRAAQQPARSHPPLCRLLCFGGGAPAKIAATLEATAAALSDALGIAGNIFIEYAVAHPGEVVDGDGLVTG